MINRFLAATVLSLALIGSSAAFAQEETSQTLPPSKVVVKAADGTTSTYLAADMSVSVSQVLAYEGTPAHDEFSFSFNAIAPVDTALLTWASLSDDKEAADVSITATFAGDDGKTTEMTYELTGAHVTSTYFGHPSYGPSSISLQVLADGLTVDGVAMN